MQLFLFDSPVKEEELFSAVEIWRAVSCWRPGLTAAGRRGSTTPLSLVVDDWRVRALMVGTANECSPLWGMIILWLWGTVWLPRFHCWRSIETASEPGTSTGLTWSIPGDLKKKTTSQMISWNEGGKNKKFCIYYFVMTSLRVTSPLGVAAIASGRHWKGMGANDG